MFPLRHACSRLALRAAQQGATAPPSCAAAAAAVAAAMRARCTAGALTVRRAPAMRSSSTIVCVRGGSSTSGSSSGGSSSSGKGFGASTSSASKRSSSSSSSSGGSSSKGSGASSTSSGGSSTSASSLGSSPASSASSGGGASDGDMYQQPQLYDEVFGYRDFAAEVAFVRAAYKRHCAGKQLGSVLELGCGPARHAALLAQGGARVWALDASRPMLDYAAKLAADAGADVAFLEADMTDFSIEGQEGQLDAVVCLLGTFMHLISNDMAAAAFRCAARHLRPGGMLLLELAHPGDLFDGSLLIGDEGGEMWEVESASQGGKLLVEWGAEGDDFNAATQVLARSVSVHRLQDGDAGDAVHASVVRQRAFTLQEVDLLGRLSGLKVVGSYGDLDLKVGLTHEDAYRLVAVLVKEGGGAAGS